MSLLICTSTTTATTVTDDRLEVIATLRGSGDSAETLVLVGGRINDSWFRRDRITTLVLCDGLIVLLYRHVLGCTDFVLGMGEVSYLRGNSESQTPKSNMGLLTN